jgi:hypothetical protein
MGSGEKTMGQRGSAMFLPGDLLASCCPRRCPFACSMPVRIADFSCDGCFDFAGKTKLTIHL